MTSRLGHSCQEETFGEKKKIMTYWKIACLTKEEENFCLFHKLIYLSVSEFEERLSHIKNFDPFFVTHEISPPNLMRKWPLILDTSPHSLLTLCIVEEKFILARHVVEKWPKLLLYSPYHSKDMRRTCLPLHYLVDYILQGNKTFPRDIWVAEKHSQAISLLKWCVESFPSCLNFQLENKGKQKPTLFGYIVSSRTFGLGETSNENIFTLSVWLTSKGAKIIPLPISKKLLWERELCLKMEREIKKESFWFLLPKVLINLVLDYSRDAWLVLSPPDSRKRRVKSNGHGRRLKIYLEKIIGETFQNSEKKFNTNLE